jgi:hypothetical protein
MFSDETRLLAALVTGLIIATLAVFGSLAMAVERLQVF